MPERIQLRRTRGWRIPADTVVVSRPSAWGNPFKVSAARNAQAAKDDFELFMKNSPIGRWTCKRAKAELRGKNLACWCPPGAPCHGDVLLEIANTEADGRTSEPKSNP